MNEWSVLRLQSFVGTAPRAAGCPGKERLPRPVHPQGGPRLRHRPKRPRASRLAYLRPRPGRPAFTATADHPAAAARRGPRSRRFRAPAYCFRVQKPPIRAAAQSLSRANLETRLRPRREEGRKAPPPGLGWSRLLSASTAP